MVRWRFRADDNIVCLLRASVGSEQRAMEAYMPVGLDDESVDGDAVRQDLPKSRQFAARSRISAKRTSTARAGVNDPGRVSNTGVYSEAVIVVREQATNDRHVEGWIRSQSG
uniref:Uncharacterized protein n=1 Tax=Mycena chlorophos TaxID=658473 RepID=A0ABQ0LWQ4_MYCCL|nr:predicted protein [Mycena chlorophos]